MNRRLHLCTATHEREDLGVIEQKQRNGTTTVLYACSVIDQTDKRLVITAAADTVLQALAQRVASSVDPVRPPPPPATTAAPPPTAAARPRAPPTRAAPRPSTPKAQQQLAEDAAMRKFFTNQSNRNLNGMCNVTWCVVTRTVTQMNDMAPVRRIIEALHVFLRTVPEQHASAFVHREFPNSSIPTLIYHRSPYRPATIICNQLQAWVNADGTTNGAPPVYPPASMRDDDDVIVEEP